MPITLRKEVRDDADVVRLIADDVFELDQQTLLSPKNGASRNPRNKTQLRELKHQAKQDLEKAVKIIEACLNDWAALVQQDPQIQEALTAHQILFCTTKSDSLPDLTQNPVVTQLRKKLSELAQKNGVAQGILNRLGMNTLPKDSVFASASGHRRPSVRAVGKASVVKRETERLGSGQKSHKPGNAIVASAVEDGAAPSSAQRTVDFSAETDEQAAESLSVSLGDTANSSEADNREDSAYESADEYNDDNSGSPLIAASTSISASRAAALSGIGVSSASGAHQSSIRRSSTTSLSSASGGNGVSDSEEEASKAADDSPISRGSLSPTVKVPNDSLRKDDRSVEVESDAETDHEYGSDSDSIASLSHSRQSRSRSISFSSSSRVRASSASATADFTFPQSGAPSPISRRSSGSSRLRQGSYSSAHSGITPTRQMGGTSLFLWGNKIERDLERSIIDFRSEDDEALASRSGGRGRRSWSSSLTERNYGGSQSPCRSNPIEDDIADTEEEEGGVEFDENFHGSDANVNVSEAGNLSTDGQADQTGAPLLSDRAPNSVAAPALTGNQAGQVGAPPAPAVVPASAAASVGPLPAPGGQAGRTAAPLATVTVPVAGAAAQVGHIPSVSGNAGASPAPAMVLNSAAGAAAGHPSAVGPLAPAAASQAIVPCLDESHRKLREQWARIAAQGTEFDIKPDGIHYSNPQALAISTINHSTVHLQQAVNTTDTGVSATVRVKIPPEVALNLEEKITIAAKMAAVTFCHKLTAEAAQKIQVEQLNIQPTDQNANTERFCVKLKAEIQVCLNALNAKVAAQDTASQARPPVIASELTVGATIGLPPGLGVVSSLPSQKPQASSVVPGAGLTIRPIATPAQACQA